MGGVWGRETQCKSLYTITTNSVSCFPLCVSCLLQVDQMLRGAPVDSAGNFDYVAFTRILKHGTKDE